MNYEVGAQSSCGQGVSEATMFSAMCSVSAEIVRKESRKDEVRRKNYEGGE
jgi:hypothetical protein